MLKHNTYNILLTISATTVCLIIGLTFYTFPAIDDYCIWEKIETLGFLGYQKHLYLNWSGRYTSNILISVSSEIFKNITLYRITLIISFILIIVALLYMGRLFAENTRKEIILFSLVLFIVLFACQAKPSQGSYWFTGVYTYTISIIFYIFGLTSYIKYIKNGSESNLLLMLISSVIIIGLNETALVMYNFMVVYLTILYFTNNYSKILGNKKLLIVLLVLIISSLISILAKGNYERQAEFAHSNISLFSGIKAATLYTGKLLISNSLPLVILTIVLLLQIRKNYTGNKLSLFILFITVFSALLIFISYLPALLATGILPPERVTNLQTQFLILSYIILIYFFRNQSNSVFCSTSKLINVLTLICIYYHLTTNNLSTLYTSYFNDSLSSYKSEQKSRIKILTDINKPDHVILKPFRHKPYLLFVDDIKVDSSNWRNLSYAKFYSIKSVKLSNE
jgi:hypothetical protein